MDINQRTAKTKIAIAIPPPIQGVSDGVRSTSLLNLSSDPEASFLLEPVDWVESVLVKDSESEDLDCSVSTVRDSITGLRPIA